MDLKCLSCNEYYNTSDTIQMIPVHHFTSVASREGPGKRYGGGVAKKNEELKAKEGCYVKARERVVELEREIEELKANVDFLGHFSPWSPDAQPRSSPLCSDVTLVAFDDTPDNPVPANKFVLASRSLVFKAMLETTMEESISGTIKISEVTRDSLHAFVNYLYTAEVCLDEKIASDLLALADKYQIKQLNELCQRYLIPFLNWDNSISYYAFAYKHSAEKLLESSLSIITKNMDKFINSDDYRDLAKKDPSFLVGIFEDYTKKHVNDAAKKESS
ncbi:hypothetical protein Dimus_024104 [Dionaea muscipula]